MIPERRPAVYVVCRAPHLGNQSSLSRGVDAPPDRESRERGRRCWACDPVRFLTPPPDDACGLGQEANRVVVGWSGWLWWWVEGLGLVVVVGGVVGSVGVGWWLVVVVGLVLLVVVVSRWGRLGGEERYGKAGGGEDGLDRARL